MPELDLRKEVRMAQLRDITGLTIDDVLEFFHTPDHPAAGIAHNRHEDCGTGMYTVVADREGGADVLLWCWVGKTHINHYTHEDCPIAEPDEEPPSWSDSWDCACDGECPKCGISISPHTSEWSYDIDG